MEEQEHTIKQFFLSPYYTNFSAPQRSLHYKDRKEKWTIIAHGNKKYQKCLEHLTITLGITDMAEKSLRWNNHFSSSCKI